MVPVLAERKTIIGGILFSPYVRSPVKIFPVSAMIERLPSPRPPSSFPLCSFYYILARFQDYLPRQPPLSFLRFNANDTLYI